MQTIDLETKIAAPIERYFLLSLSIDLHKASTAGTEEEVIAGVSRGIIGLNETVTWRARHFGLKLTHATLISEYTRPTHFRDIMIRGAFRSFVHDHFFKEEADGGTCMRDVLRFSAPLGPLGWLAETIVLRWYLERFLETRNRVIQRVAESPEAWKAFIPETNIASDAR